MVRITMSSLSLHKLKKKSPKKINIVKKINRFDGLSEDEVKKCTLPDILQMNLDIIFIGINPGLMSAHRRRYYAGPGNHFYKLLHASGLLPTLLNFEHDYKLPKFGIGLTNIVSRATKSSSELTKTEIKEGAVIIKEKINLFKPKIAVFNGKCIYEIFADKSSKDEFFFGLQPEFIGETAIWVVPSSSARCSHFPRMNDKLIFYLALKKYLDYIKGEIIDVQINDFVFEGKCKPAVPSTSKMWRRKNVSAFLHGGRIANSDTFCLDTSDEAIACSTEFILNEIKGTNENDKKNSNIKNDTERINDKDQKTENLIQGKDSKESTKKREYSTDFVTLIKQRILYKHVDETSTENL